MVVSNKIITHDFPVWREKADFIIAVRLGEELGIGDLFQWEQLWARKVDNNRFRLCCIPFFAYGFGLDDEVTTKPQGERKYVVDQINSSSGRRTYRVFFLSLIRWSEIIDEIVSLGCNVEVRWKRSTLISIDAQSSKECDLLESLLDKLQRNGEITWENGN